MCCKLWVYNLGVSLPLMRLAELMQCIEFGGYGYFTWIFLFFFACTFLPPSSVFCLLVQVACSMPLEVRSLFGLFRQSVSSTSILKLSFVYWVKSNEGIGLSPPRVRPIELYFVLGSHLSYNTFSNHMI